jgi:DNA ligase-4
MLKKPVHVPQSLKMKFIILVRYFQKVGQVRGKKKNEVTQMFFENFALKEDRHPQYTYTLLRLMMPFYDRDRGVYKL